MEIAGFVVLGLVAGMLGAALGVGGGVVFVPVLVILFDFVQHEAQGTSLAVIVPTMVVAAVVHARGKRIVWQIAPVVAAGGLVGGVLGARWALAIDADVLRRLFAVMLVVVAVRMARKAQRLSREHRDAEQAVS